MYQESVIRDAIDQFPAIKELIGVEKLTVIAGMDGFSPMLYYLSKSLLNQSKISELVSLLKKDPNHIGVLFCLDRILYPHYVVKHLNTCLSAIRDEGKLSVLVDHVLNPDSFWQGYCEVETAAILKQNFGSVELEPTLPNGKTVDVAFPLNSGRVYVEITVPKKGYKFSNALEESAKAHKVVQMPNVVERASERIVTELKHFAGILSDVPSMIIINLNESDFDDIDIEDSLMGVSKFVILIDRLTRVTTPKPIRESWTAFSRNEELAKVGAVICYKRDFDLSGKVVFSKRIFGISLEKEKCEALSKLF